MMEGSRTEAQSHRGGIEEVTMFRTTDGKTFSNRLVAKGHQSNIDQADEANEMLGGGQSIGEILRHFGRHEDPILDQVVKHSELVIEYCQCRSTPGYKPIRFEPGLSLYVFGHAGSWGGPYGGNVTINELVRYAKDKRSKL